MASIRNRLRSSSFESTKKEESDGDEKGVQQGDNTSSNKENGDDPSTLGDFRRYSSRKRKHTNHFLVETFQGRSYSYVFLQIAHSYSHLFNKISKFIISVVTLYI